MEITEDGQGQPVVCATPRGSRAGSGYVPQGKVNIIFINSVGGTLNEGAISASPYPDFHTGAPAPPCTYLSYYWCKCPYCPSQEPQWPPWTSARSCFVSQSCPSPAWEPTYHMNLSTAIQACNVSGFVSDAPPAGAS